jgi:hypothetical protein
MLSFRIFIPYILGFDAPDFRYFSVKRPFFSGGSLQHRFIPPFDYFWVLFRYLWPLGYIRFISSFSCHWICILFLRIHLD